MPYKVERAESTVYLDKGGKPVTGYVLTVYLPEFDELHDVKVPTLDPDAAKAAIGALIEHRKNLATLGQ